MKNKTIVALFAFVLLVGIAVVFRNSIFRKALDVGYASGTTGMLSEVGVDGRNAFLLRIDEINDSGGVNGVKINPIVMNDENTAEGVTRVHQVFDRKQVHFVVGHILSSLDEAVLTEAQKKTKLLLSASMTSPRMDNLDDYFIRIASSYIGQVNHICSHMTTVDHIDSLTVVYDTRNKSYSEGFFHALEDRFPGSIKGYAVGTGEEAISVIRDRFASQPTEGLLMITPANLTALMCQTLKVLDIDTKQYTVSWSMTNDLFSDGGSAVEGLKIVYLKPDEGYEEKYEAFRSAFLARYGYEPSTICFSTYEITSLLIEAIARTGSTDVDVVRHYLLDRQFEGLYGDIHINAYGDREQAFAMYQVSGESFVLMK